MDEEVERSSVYIYMREDIECDSIYFRNIFSPFGLAL